MRFYIALLMALPLWCTQALSEEVVLGLSHDRVEITTRFEGSEILIFGAIKREEPVPEGSPLEIVMTLSGPLEPVTVRSKARKLGIWVNTETLEVDLAPTFYAISTSGPMQEVMSDTENLRYKVSIPRAIRSVGAPMTIEDAEIYREAVIRIRKNEGIYKQEEGAVEIRDETLFQGAISMPANLTEGDYALRIFLLRDQKVVSLYETTIDVEKVGLERWLYELSRNQPLLYGLMSIAIAIFAGWAASGIFQLIRR